MSKDMKHEAKRNMLQELKKMASGMLGEDLKGKMDSMKKVTVAGKDNESLKKGLEVAEEILGDTEEDMDNTDEKAQEEVAEAGNQGRDMETDDNDTAEQIQAKIEELQNKLNSKKK